MITYKIASTKFTVNPDGTQGRITFVIWNAEKKVGEVVGRINRRGTPIPPDYAPADAEYQTITEQDVIDWIVDLEDQASIEAQLDAVVSALETPTTGTGRPWQDSFPLWAVGVAVAVGYIAIYQGRGYEVVQAHTTQSQWAPPATPALWKLYVPPSEGPQPWVQPTGAQDAYEFGEQVTHVGRLWTSDISANVFEPGVSSWTDEGVFP
jgi:hypothetical protein